MVVMVIIEGAVVEAIKKNPPFIEFFYTEHWKPSFNPHSTFNSHNHPTRKVLPSKFYRKPKGSLKKLCICPRDTASWKDRVLTQDFDRFFFP